MSVDTLSGAELRAAITSASDYLTASAKAVDAINVYPVPDGDTGSNMAATLREACDHMLALEEPLAAGQVLATFARGALYGGPPASSCRSRCSGWRRAWGRWMNWAAGCSRRG